MSVSPCGPRLPAPVVSPAWPAGSAMATAEKPRIISGRDQQGQHRHHDLLALDLLAQVLRRAAHHQPGDEDRDDGEHQHAVESCADPSKDDLTQRDVGDQHQPAERRIAIVEALDVPVEVAVVVTSWSDEMVMPIAHLLALHIAARLCGADHLVRPDAGQQWIAGLLGGDDDGQADHEEDGRDDPEHPALPRVAHPSCRTCRTGPLPG